MILDDIVFIEMVLDDKIKRIYPPFKRRIIISVLLMKDVIILENIKKKNKCFMFVFLKNMLGINKLKNGTSVTSKKYFEVRGWPDFLIQEKIKESTNKINYQQNSPYCIEHWIKKGFSEEDAKVCIKSGRKLNKEYWIKKGFSEDDANKNVSIFQKSQNIKANSNYANDRTSTQPAYWIKKGFTKEETKIKLANRQNTTSLKARILQHGLKAGILKYNSTRSNSIVREAILKAYLNNKNDVNNFLLDFEKIKNNILKNRNGHASKESLIFFEPLFNALQHKYVLNIGAFGFQELKLDNIINVHSDNKFFRYDFVVQNVKVIFEYDCPFFHKQNCLIDMEKDNVAKLNGYKIYRIIPEYPLNLQNKRKIIEKIFDICVSNNIDIVLNDFNKHKFFRNVFKEFLSKQFFNY